jgi:hypothetical protein
MHPRRSGRILGLGESGRPVVGRVRRTTCGPPWGSRRASSARAPAGCAAVGAALCLELNWMIGAFMAADVSVVVSENRVRHVSVDAPDARWCVTRSCVAEREDES